jgi:putative AdoMet-dependent methyltransferase
MSDLFPPSDFDDWAETYDLSVSDQRFPFIGYRELLDEVISLAAPGPQLAVLDLGTGTGNLASLFDRFKCVLWCTDFSLSMLKKARQKIPAACFFLHNLRDPLPLKPGLLFDRIISTYTFHHFKPDEKVNILHDLASGHLSADGGIVIGDIGFQNQSALEKVKLETGVDWEDEFYWIADEMIPALEINGMKWEYVQVSSCAGVYSLKKTSHGIV